MSAFFRNNIMKKNFLALIFTILGGISLQAQTCDTVRVFPWNNDFYTNFGCWEQLGDSSSLWQLNAGSTYNIANAAYITAPYDSAANGCVLVSPALALPADTTNMRLSFRTRRVGTSVQLHVLVSNGLRDDLSDYDTLLTITQPGNNSYEVNLSAYAGQTVYVAFSLVKPNPSNTLTFFGVGSVNIISDRMPQGEWLIQNMAARTGDTVEHEFYLTQGIEDDSNTVFTWHSTMVEAGQATLVEMVSDMLIFYDYSAVRTLPRSIYRVIYHTPGIDTVTVTASNVYGTITSQSVSHIYDCAPIASFPWAMERGDLGVCWSTDYSISSSASYGYRDEDGEMYYTDWYLQSPTYTENYVVTNAIAVPTDAAHLALILRWSYGIVEVRAALAGQGTDMMDFVADTTLFTDLLFNEAGSNVIKTRKVSLAAYAGDTIRLAIIHKSSNVLNVMPLSIDYDTLPKIAAVQVPSMATVDLAALCTASLRYGATEGLHYSWSSARGGVFVTNALGDSAWLTYPGGVGDNDTIRVVAENIYGTDTVVRTVHILDCTPQLILPWKETFAYGTACWYKYDGCKFYDAIPNSSLEHQRHLYLNTQTDTLGSWIMSKAIAIPADTNLCVTLFWKVASSNTSYRHLYSMLATTSDEYTDTANYTVLYTDSSRHVNFSNYDTRSVSLTPYAGQTIHIAIHNHGNHMAWSGIGLYLDDIEVRTTELPVVSLSVPTIVNSHDVVNYTATCAEGSMNGLTLTWRSSLMDTTWVMNGSDGVNRQYVLEMMYTLDGIDTVTVIASNAYGTATATAVVFVNDCTPIATLPYEEPFINVVATAYNASSGGNIPNCWRRFWNGSNNYSPHVIYNYFGGTAIHTYTQTNPALALMAGTDDGFDSVAIVESPLFEVPLNEQMLSFFYMYESASYGQLSVGYIQNGTFVDLADLTPQTAGKTDTVSLSGIPADVHRFAFCWKKTGTWYGAIVDNIRMFTSDGIPSVRLTAPATAFVDDSTTFSASLTNGQIDGLTYTWQSTLLDDTVTGGRQWSVVYTTEGIDTVTVIATNAYGSDTAWAVVTVVSHPLPQVTISAPTTVYIPDIATFNITLNDCSHNGLTVTCHSSMLDTTIDLNSTFFTLNYTLIGVDTVTVIASNAYGTATAVAVVHIIDCRSAAAPYYEDFEGVTPTAWDAASCYLPGCWSSIAIGASHKPKVVSSYQYISNLPDQALLIMAGNNTGYADAAYAMLPSFSDSLQHLSVAFDYRSESASYGALTVGYWNDSLLTFHPVQNIASHTGSYLRDTVSFADVTGADNHTHIALKWYCNSSFYGVVIDNIEVFRDLHIQAPEMLTVENVTATCATLRWSDVDIATAYRITLGGAMSLDTVVTDTTITLCNLEDDADYNVMVVPLVGSDAGRSASTTFHTMMLCAPLASVSISPECIINWQYDTIGAEQAPVGVEIKIIDHQGMLLVHTDTAYFGPYVPDNISPGHTYSFVVRTLCTSSTAHTADTVVMQVAPSVCAEVASTGVNTYSHFMDNFWDANYSQVLYPSSFVNGIDTLYGIALRVAQFTGHFYTSQTYRFDIYVGQTTASSLTAPLTSDSLTAVAQNTSFTVSEAGWVNILFDSIFVCDDNKSLIVTMVQRSSNPYGTIYYGVHTDASCTHFVQDEDHLDAYTNPSTLNFQWETNTNIPDIRLLGGCGGSVNTCLAPEVEVTAVDTHSVSLQWQQRGSENLWKVEYRPVGTGAWQLADTTSATSFTITGLAQATHYLVRVGSVCSDSLIAYGFPDSATTFCGYMELPYTISFLADEYPCWTLSNNLYYNNWNGITLSEWNNSYIISPEVNTNIADLRATITSECAISSYTPRFAVGVCNADGSNVTWIDTIGFLQQNTEQVDEIHFNHYTGSGRYIILRAVEASCYIHQFNLEPFAGCVPVHDVTVDNISEHSAQLTWVPELTTNTWAVYLDDSLVATTTTPSYTLTGLNSNTQYTVGVSEICPSGSTSTAVTRMFQTLCDAFALPYFEEFDQAPAIGSERILTDCWVFHKTGIYATAHCTGDQWTYTCLSFDDSNEGYDIINYLSSPRLTVGSGGALVAFKGQTTYFDTFTVGIMLSPYDTSTFIPVRDITVSAGGMAWYSFSTDTIAGAPISGTFTLAFRFNGEHGSGIIDSLTVTANPAVEYTLSLMVNDTTMGSVSGAGTYEAGAVVTVTATPNEGYRFVTWNDSVTVPTRVIDMTKDLELTAYFAPDGVGISSVVEDANDIVIHPNPTTGDAYISVGMPSVVTVTDLQGRTVIQPTQVDSTLRIAEGTLPKGIYFVSVGNSAGTVVKKLVIQ